MVTVNPCACQPAAESGIDMAGEPNQNRDVHPLGEQPETHLDPVGMGLQVIEWGIPA